MKMTPAPLNGLLVLEPAVHTDERGSFSETFNEQVWTELTGLKNDFVQDNQSISRKGVLRGLHFQKPPFAQGKLVRVTKGKVWDVAVDMRKNTLTFGQYWGLELSAENKKQLWIPPGFAHGFVALEDDTVFLYKCTALYNKESEGGLRWDDPGIAIKWPMENPIVSEKDQKLPGFNDFISPF